MNAEREVFGFPMLSGRLCCRAAAETALMLACLLSWAAAVAESVPNLMLGRSVVKVMADSSTGRVSMGSGVVVAQDRVATNCHVTRSANSIVVSKGISGYPVVAQSALPEQDVCILHTLNLKLPAARLGKISQVSPGDEIFVFGFPSAVGLGMVRGVVRELHALGDDFILETDAGFMRGTSGGALFTAQGDLIALPTFMLKDESGGHFYAVPVEWVRKALAQHSSPVSELDGLTFWESGRFGKGKN
ncbi:MAG: serine protease [Methylococcaceae bacterium]|nr:serine protease [Methylococcaceae bacterium]